MPNREYYIKKSHEKHCEERQKSLCTHGIYKNNIERAFHNCFVRAKNFQGYIDEFQKVIENTFKYGMTWNNYGEWEVDHIIPLAKKGEHSTKNIQALWMTENRSKHTKILPPN